MSSGDRYERPCWSYDSRTYSVSAYCLDTGEQRFRDDLAAHSQRQAEDRLRERVRALGHEWQRYFYVAELLDDE